MSLKTEQINLRATPSQRQQWQEAADSDERTLVDWIRTRLDRISREELEQTDAKKSNK